MKTKGGKGKNNGLIWSDICGTAEGGKQFHVRTLKGCLHTVIANPTFQFDSNYT